MRVRAASAQGVLCKNTPINHVATANHLTAEWCFLQAVFGRSPEAADMQQIFDSNIEQASACLQVPA
jgi:hypothetical protein